MVAAAEGKSSSKRPVPNRKSHHHWPGITFSGDHPGFQYHAPGQWHPDSTLPSRVSQYNQIVANVADELNIPLWNLWVGLSALPSLGVGADYVHLTVSPNGDSQTGAADVAFGMNYRNLTALVTLNKLVSIVELNGTPDQTPPYLPNGIAIPLAHQFHIPVRLAETRRRGRIGTVWSPIAGWCLSIRRHSRAMAFSRTQGRSNHTILHCLSPSRSGHGWDGMVESAVRTRAYRE